VEPVKTDIFFKFCVQHGGKTTLISYTGKSFIRSSLFNPSRIERIFVVKLSYINS
jgi:hypothetical protein